MIRTTFLAPLLAACLLIPYASESQAVDRCNIKFTFDNRMDYAITIRKGSSILINGNRGSYIERLDKDFTVPRGQRRTTRRNRLQMVDDGTRADFTVIVNTPHGPLSTYQKNLPSNAAERLGITKKDHICKDSDQFIEFVIQPLPDTTATRRTLASYANNRHRNNREAVYERLLRLFLNVTP